MQPKENLLKQFSNHFFTPLQEGVETLLASFFGSINLNISAWISELSALMPLILICLLAYYLSQVGIKVITRITKYSNTKIDDYLWRKTFYNKLPHLMVVAVLYLTASDFPLLFPFLHKASLIYLSILCLLLFFNGLDSFANFISATKKAPNHFNLKGISQAIKLFAFLIFIVYNFSILLGETPWRILSGIGAITAVLILVFRDTILGFVAGIQIYVNDLLRIGDWIEMPIFNADGDVVDISLMTVKIQNWDKTITNLPTYSLVTNSFKNWRGMQTTGGRRIKRQFFIDASNISFVSATQLKKLKKIPLLKSYFTSPAFKEALDPNKAYKDLTNLGIFREYAYHFIKNHPDCRRDLTHLVRVRPFHAKGLPLEIYFFCSKTNWVEFERIQSEVIEHLTVASTLFDLKLFQDPSGMDFKKVFSIKKSV